MIIILVTTLLFSGVFPSFDSKVIGTRLNSTAIIPCLTDSSIFSCTFKGPSHAKKHFIYFKDDHDCKPAESRFCYGGTSLTHGDCTLKISNVKKADLGTWMCQLRTYEGEMIYVSFNLTLKTSDDDEQFLSLQTENQEYSFTHEEVTETMTTTTSRSSCVLTTMGRTKRDTQKLRIICTVNGDDLGDVNGLENCNLHSSNGTAPILRIEKNAEEYYILYNQEEYDSECMDDIICTIEAESTSSPISLITKIGWPEVEYRYHFICQSPSTSGPPQIEERVAYPGRHRHPDGVYGATSEYEVDYSFGCSPYS